MIIYLQGSDSYLASQAIRGIVDRYRRQHPQNLELNDLSPPERFNLADLRALPLLASHRLFILRRVGQLTLNDQTTLAGYLQDLPETTVAVVWDERQTAEVLQRVLSQGKIITVLPLSGLGLTRWLSATAQSLGLLLSPQESQELVNRFFNNLWALKSELELIALDRGHRGPWQPNGQPGSFFSLVGRGAWPALRRELIKQWRSGAPFELIIGSLAAASRSQAKGADRLWLTSLLANADLAVKIGLMEPATAIGFLSGRLAGGRPSTLQWQVLWREIISCSAC